MGCRCGVSDYPDTQKPGDDPKSRSWTSLSLLNPTSSQSQVAPPRFQPRGKAQGAAVEEDLNARPALRPLPSCQTGFPRLPASPFRRAMPSTPADRTGARVDCFPIRAAFPVLQAGRHPHLYFRGLLRLHSRYGPSDRSTAKSGLCHEAPARPVTRPSRSSATGSIDNSPGGTFLLVVRAFGAHCKILFD